MIISLICLEINAFLLLDIVSSFYDMSHVRNEIYAAVIISNRCQLSCKLDI